MTERCKFVTIKEKTNPWVKAKVAIGRCMSYIWTGDQSNEGPACGGLLRVCSQDRSPNDGYTASLNVECTKAFVLILPSLNVFNRTLFFMSNAAFALVKYLACLGDSHAASLGLTIQ